MGASGEHGNTGSILGAGMSRGDLPAVLVEQYRELGISEKRASGIKARLDYIEEVVEKINAWLSEKGGSESLKLFLDDLEVDVAVNLSVTLDESKGLEPGWVDHHAWTAELEAKPLQQHLSPVIRQGLDQRLLPLDATDEEVESWLRGQAGLLRGILDGFYSSVTIESTAAYLMALDVSLAYDLACLVKMRLR